MAEGKNCVAEIRPGAAGNDRQGIVGEPAEIYDSVMTAMSSDLKASPDYLWLRARKWEGTFPGDSLTGCWGSSIHRVLFGLGYVTQTEWHRTPHIDEWPPIEPSLLDDLAVRRRIKWYSRVRSARDCLSQLGLGLSVSAGLYIDQSWLAPRDGLVGSGTPNNYIGIHAIGLTHPSHSPFSLSHSQIPFANSWGPDWGLGGWGIIESDDFDHGLVECWSNPSELTPYTPTGKKSSPTVIHNRFLLRTKQTIHRIVVVDRCSDIRIAWGMAQEIDSELQIDDLFVQPDYRRVGWGTVLLQQLRKIALRNKRQLVANIPFSDWYADSVKGVNSFFKANNFAISRSKHNWAAAIAIADGSDSDLPPPIELPRPSFSLQNELESRRKNEFEHCLADVLARRESALKRLAE